MGLDNDHNGHQSGIGPLPRRAGRCRWISIAVLAAIPLFALTGCGDSGEVKKVIRNSLVDPDSAKFRGGVLKSKDGSRACIEVNAKNKMGGYTGFTPMVVTKIDGKWDVPSEFSSNDCAYWLEALSK